MVTTAAAAPAGPAPAAQAPAKATAAAARPVHPYKEVLAGSVAAVASTLVCHPIDVLRTELQTQAHATTARACLRRIGACVRVHVCVCGRGKGLGLGLGLVGGDGWIDGRAWCCDSILTHTHTGILTFNQISGRGGRKGAVQGPQRAARRPGCL
jgi:hypothetical protein